MGDIRKALAAIVQDRKEIGLTSQKKLARKIGCSESQVSSLLSGERRLNEDWILKFCSALGIAVGELLANAGDGERAQGAGNNPHHRQLHLRLQRLLEAGMEEIVAGQLKLMESELNQRNKI